MNDEIYDTIKRKRVKMPNKMKDYIDEIIEISKKYGLSISHEDGQGAFEIEKYDECYTEWLKHAHKSYEEE